MHRNLYVTHFSCRCFRSKMINGITVSVIPLRMIQQMAAVSYSSFCAFSSKCHGSIIGIGKGDTREQK